MRHYTVTAERVVDTGYGMLNEPVQEQHGLSEADSVALAEQLAACADNHVFVTFSSDDGQSGYLNRDGHNVRGVRW